MPVMSNVLINTPEWLASRKLGSSDAAAILGVNPYRTPYQVWGEKTGILGPCEENEAMRWGKLLEPVIAQEFSERSSLKIEKNMTMAVHKSYDFMTATADYFVWDNDEFGLLEIKNVNGFSVDYDSENIADYTTVQVMHQMAVYGLPWAYVAFLKGGNKLFYQKVYRHEELIKKIETELKKFWQLVLNKTAPPMSGGDGSLLDEMYPTSNKQSIQLPSAERLAFDYMAAKKEARLADSRADDYAARIKAKMGYYELAHAGPYRISWKSGSNKNRRFMITELKNGQN